VFQEAERTESSKMAQFLLEKRLLVSQGPRWPIQYWRLADGARQRGFKAQRTEYGCPANSCLLISSLERRVALERVLVIGRWDPAWHNVGAFYYLVDLMRAFIPGSCSDNPQWLWHDSVHLT
jgi:hypothetical protein